MFNRQIGAGLPGLGTLGASSEAPMSSAAAPAESMAGCGDEEAPARPRIRRVAVRTRMSRWPRAGRPSRTRAAMRSPRRASCSSRGCCDCGCCDSPSASTRTDDERSRRSSRHCTTRSRHHWRRQGGPRGPSPPNGRAKNFFVKIEGLLEPVVLNLSFRVLSNAMFTSERRY